ncbi:MAG TPA: GYF domain-containing protein [Opitutaceae bacterium]|nr:GYF domain-containing protein [Opitutaceae bacterium]HND60271.1 GYF domain-containing protein [Opitutaceae bacterium]
MAIEEIYIRNETETEARGPFNLEQLVTLAENGQVTAETLYYDAGTEQWVALGSNQDMLGQVFPQKKKLKIKTKVKMESLNQESESAAPITVDDMLAAAEGRTAETAGRADPMIAMARAAAIGRWAIVLMLILAAAGEALPSVDAIMSVDVAKLMGHPLVALGAVDLILAVVLALGVVSIYPFIRFRAALGLGFLGFIFWVHGQPMSILALAGGSLGLYVSTVFVSYAPVLFFGALGIVGLGAVSWFLLS